MPTTGKIVVESHLATTADTFEKKTLFPAGTDDSIEAHLDRSCTILKTMVSLKNCSDIYRATWSRHGRRRKAANLARAQSAIENQRCSKSYGSRTCTGENTPGRPPALDSWQRMGDRHVVVVMGYEAGPTSSTILAGIQTEAGLST